MSPQLLKRDIYCDPVTKIERHHPLPASIIRAATFNSTLNSRIHHSKPKRNA